MAAALSATLGKLPRVFLSTGNCRFLSVSPCNLMKEIKHSEKDNHITVEGIYVSGENKQTKASDACRGGQVTCHSFCKSPFVAQVKHTDVLILNQFVDSKGQMYSQEELEICHRQWTRLFKMVQMCQRAGLMPGKEFYCKEIRQTKWGSQNCYWDENTIEIQHKENLKKSKRREFISGRFKNW